MAVAAISGGGGSGSGAHCRQAGAMAEAEVEAVTLSATIRVCFTYTLGWGPSAAEEEQLRLPRTFREDQSWRGTIDGVTRPQLRVDRVEAATSVCS